MLSTCCSILAALCIASVAFAAPNAVRPISCQDKSRGLFGPPSQLRIYTTPAGIKANAMRTGSAGDLLGIGPVRLVNETGALQRSQLGNNVTFMYDQCYSQTIGVGTTKYPDGANTTAGHVVTTAGLCLTYDGRSTTTQDCSYADDADQFLQTWIVHYPANVSKPATVDFYGGANQTFRVGYGYLGGNAVVSVIQTTNATQKSWYQLALANPS